MGIVQEQDIKRLYITIGDVSGKGLDAGLVVSSVKSYLSSFAIFYESPLKILSVLNQNLYKYLGVPQYLDNEANKHDEVGVATGLAWTEVGGDIMNIETSLIKGKGNLILTGKLGEVMQESAKASLTYIRSKSNKLGYVSSWRCGCALFDST